MSIAIFIVGLIFLIAFSVKAIIKTDRYCKAEQHGKGVDRSKRSEPCAQGFLEQTGTEATSLEKAKSFLLLMENGEILIHTFVNEGNKYDDAKQTKRFRQLLTNDVIQSINSIEGKDIW